MFKPGDIVEGKSGRIIEFEKYTTSGNVEFRGKVVGHVKGDRSEIGRVSNYWVSNKFFLKKKGDVEFEF